MKEKALSQSELGRITGIKQATISDYVKGNSIPSAERFHLIALALGVSMDYLWGASCVPSDATDEAGDELKWRARALSAEKRLAKIGDVLVLLGKANATLTEIASGKE